MNRLIFKLCLWTAMSFGAHAQAQVNPPSLPPDPLTTEEALEFIKGKNRSATRMAGGNPSLQFKEGGAMYGNNAGSSDSGKWRIEDSKLCMSWRTWEYDGCGALVRVGNEIHHLYPHGTAVHLIFRK